jgi:hypothetical protein
MNPHLKYDDEVCTISEPSQMSNEELNTIIRLIPHASTRQTSIIEGQIQIHKQLNKANEKK